MTEIAYGAAWEGAERATRTFAGGSTSVPARVPEGNCTRCGKRVRLHCPRHGDGSVLFTYCWHKDLRDRSRWCRSELDGCIEWVAP